MQTISRKAAGLFDRRPACSASGVLQQCLKPVVHMVLDMAMKQCRPWLVGGKVHAHPAIRGSHHRILDDARRCPSVDLRDFELMPVQVQRMRIVRPVAESQSVARTRLQHELPVVRIRRAVHCEQVELPGPAAPSRKSSPAAPSAPVPMPLCRTSCSPIRIAAAASIAGSAAGWRTRSPRRARRRAPCLPALPSPTRPADSSPPRRRCAPPAPASTRPLPRFAAPGCHRARRY